VVVRYKILRTDLNPIIQQERERALLDMGQMARGIARKTARRRTGRLRNSIKRSGIMPSRTAKTVRVKVYTDIEPAARAVWEEEGTGIYGPRKRPITPKKAKVLAWVATGGGRTNLAGLAKRAKMGGKRSRGSGGMIFARSVKGMPGTHFMRTAFKGSEAKKYFAARLAQMAASIAARSQKERK
jgi:hypothetical protein